MSWSRSEFEAQLRGQGSAYHIHHPYSVLLNGGGASRDQIRGWVANRYYYQINIPLKDAAILANCPDRAVRRGWVQRIIDTTAMAMILAASSRGCAWAKRALIKKYDYPIVLNVVLHRLNIDHVEQILEMADSLGADYVELANTQYYGWAWHNRAQLLPSRVQVECAETATQRFRERGRPLRIYFVVPDYFERRPKPCMNGLGSVFLTITPDGTALPCHAARMLPGLEFPNVRESSIEQVWYESAAFGHFRGDS